MHFTDEEIEALRIYRYIQVESKPHNLDELYKLDQLEIDIHNPQSTVITMGDTQLSMTDINANTKKNVATQAEIIKDDVKKQVGEATVVLEKHVNQQVVENMTSFVDIIRPVGSVYISQDVTSPASLFGGTWERLKDKFILAAGDTSSAGSTGGESAHTLTRDEMPSHAHGFMLNIQHGDGESVPNSEALTSGLQVGGVRRYPDATDASGGNQPHNNMPHYIAYYVWIRIA